MNQAEVEAFISSLDDVQRTESFGYIFFFVGDEQMRPFVTIAQEDHEYDHVSNLSCEGVFQLNIGVSGKTL